MSRPRRKPREPAGGLAFHESKTLVVARPEVNAKVGRHRVDFLWPEHRLIVELDGWQFHGHRLAFERDRARDVELQLAGYTVLRVTWRQLRDEPAAVAARVARFLSPPASRTAA